ncbi:MAG TPA: 2-methylcitrate dehydratase, partial [Alphaproteobacteria bacterium]|nr:2-methylcitrate dehydratase [Alphaproteobacteria bacterium]
DYDDTHFASLGHPSVTVIPAVVALADRTGASMAEVKQAVLTGAEVAIRLGVWLGRDHYRTGFHVTGTAGTFGAVA